MHGTVTFGGVSYTNPSLDNDAYLAAFDPSGGLIWGMAFHGDGGPAPTRWQ